MLSLKNRMLQPRLVAGVTVSLGGEHTAYHLLLLKRDKEEINLQENHLAISSLDELKKLIPAGIPIHLSIHGRGVLHRQTSDVSLNGVEVVLPNADPDQFYTQGIPATNGMVYSIARCQMIDDLLSEFNNKELWVIELSFGPFEVYKLWPYLAQSEKIDSLDMILSFGGEGRLDRFDPDGNSANKKVNIGDDLIANDLLPAYAGALMLLTGVNGNLTTPVSESLRNEFFQKQIFDRGWKFVVGLIGLILLLNTGFYYYYKQKNNQLVGASSYALSQIAELDTLRAKVERQEQLIQTTSINQRTDVSFYADEVGRSLPTGLKLRSVDIFPIQGEEKDYEKNSLVKYDRQRIVIKGQCSSSLTYNQWIKSLESLKWINKVQHIDYKDIHNQLAEFEMNLFIEASL